MPSQLHTASPRPTLEPYLPRIARTWADESVGRRWREVDGTLVSVDIAGFTRLSERLAEKGRSGAEELIVLLDRCFQGLIGIAERHGGDVLKFRGDALLLFYDGALHQRRACQAAAEMQGFIDGIGRTETSVGALGLRMSTGAHSGLCQFFMVGASHRELVVTGRAATATVALEKEAGAGQIVVSDATARALDGRWLGPRVAAGRFLRRTGLAALPVLPAGGPISSGGDVATYIPLGLREVIAAGGGEGEHRQVTVAFIRSSGTDSQLAEDGPEPVFDRLQELAEAIDATCASLGVVWLESDIAADGAVFYLTAGAPTTSGGDEERMLRAVRSIMDAPTTLPLRIGVNRGIAFAGEIGAPSRRTYAVMGDPVNLAARLMQRAGPGEVLASEDVLERSAARFRSQALEPFLVKGRRRPVIAHQLGAMERERSTTRAGTLPIVGREHELTILREALRHAAAGRGRVVELVAEPGMGKSRLIEELLDAATGKPALVTTGEQYETSTPYHSFRPILRALAGIGLYDAPDAAGARLAEWVGKVAPELAAWLPLIAIPVDASVAATAEVERTAPAFRRGRLQQAVLDLLEAALRSPTLLVFEDAHWMDEASWDLLRQVAARASSLPWLVCVTRRPGSPPGAELGPETSRIALRPLESSETAALVLMAAGDSAIPDHTLSTLAEHSGGNPLFLRELVAGLRSADRVGPLPETVESLITARIDTLSPDIRLLLRSSAVAGATVDVDLLEEVLGNEARNLIDPARWERLGEFLEWGGPRQLRFRHDLFRAVAYEGLAFRRRRLIHGRLARAIERRAGDETDDLAGLLSLHYLRADEYEPAWRYAIAAGDRARARFANIVAAELYERALEAAARLPTLDAAPVAAAAEALGDVSELAARYDDAAKAYGHASRLVPGGDQLASARLMQKRGVLRERAGRYTDALRWYGRGLRVLATNVSQSEAPRIRSEIELAYAGVLYRQGRYADSVRWGLRAAADAESTGDRGALAHAYYLLDAAYTDLGRPESAHYRELALPIFEEVGDLIGQGNVLNNLGIDAYYEGRWGEALELYGRSRQLKQRAGDVVNAAIQSNNEAEILSDQGRLQDAEALLRDALRVWRAAHYSVGIALATSNLGRVASRAARFPEAHRLLDEALDGFRAMGAASFVLETQARVLECLLLQGETERASAVAESAFPKDREVGGVSVLEAMVERLRGYLDLQAGRVADAATHLGESLRIGRSLKAEYEVALTMRALADLERVERGSVDMELERESATTLERLGVVSVPAFPLRVPSVGG